MTDNFQEAFLADMSTAAGILLERMLGVYVNYAVDHALPEQPPSFGVFLFHQKLAASGSAVVKLRPGMLAVAQRYAAMPVEQWPTAESLGEPLGTQIEVLMQTLQKVSFCLPWPLGLVVWHGEKLYVATQCIDRELAPAWVEQIVVRHLQNQPVRDFTLSVTRPARENAPGGAA